MKKIDPVLLEQVELLNNNKKSVECLIYSNDFFVTKNYSSITVAFSITTGSTGISS